MCESNAYILRDGKEELVFKDVASMEPQGENLLLRGVLGNPLEVKKVRLLKMDFMAHKILLEEIK